MLIYEVIDKKGSITTVLKIPMYNKLIPPFNIKYYFIYFNNIIYAPPSLRPCSGYLIPSFYSLRFTASFLLQPPFFLLRLL